jgi:hypothetical protein
VLRSFESNDFGAVDRAVSGTTQTQAVPFGDPASGTVESYLVRIKTSCGPNGGYASNA